MKRLIATELLKQRTTRLVAGTVLAVPVVAVLVAVAVLGAAGHQGNDPLGPDSFVHALGGPTSVVTFMALLLGILGAAGEYRHATITTTFLATPRRSRVIVAKLVAYALTGALMALVSLVASVAVAVPWLTSADIAVRLDGDAVRMATGLIGSSVLHAALGVAIGALIRNQTAAMTAVLVWWLAVEGILGDVFPRLRVLAWLPASAGRAITALGSQPGRPAAALAAAALAAYVGVLAAAAVRITSNRDIT